MLLNEIKEFCSETSIHGLGQIANDKLSILKRLLWFGIFAGCIAYAGTQLVFSIKGEFSLISKHVLHTWSSSRDLDL